MSTVTVHLRGMSGTLDLEVPESATAADVRAEAGISENLGFAIGGQRVDREQEASTPVAADQTYTTLPPEVKAGA